MFLHNVLQIVKLLLTHECTITSHCEQQVFIKQLNLSTDVKTTLVPLAATFF